MLVRGCHAPVFVRQGTAEARHRAPTYRERWVKNDGSGTLGLFGDQRSPRQSGCVFSIDCDLCKAAHGSFYFAPVLIYTKKPPAKGRR